MRARYFLVAVLFLAATALAPARAAAEPPLKADRLLVEKSRHLLTLFSGDDRVLRRYRVALGAGGLGPKRRQGDARVPEGRYVIDWRNPNSAYHLALHVSYPDAADAARAAVRGENPGGDIMIHGLPNGFGVVGAPHHRLDWTAGCIAVTDAEIEEIWQAVPDGTPIEIRR